MFKSCFDARGSKQDLYLKNPVQADSIYCFHIRDIDVWKVNKIAVMKDEEFGTYLRKGGRKPGVIERIFRLVTDYELFLSRERDVAGPDLAAPADLEAFVADVERSPKTSAKTHLWAIRYYYTYSENEQMASFAAMLREERIVRTPFSLGDFRGINPGHVEALALLGISNVQQMLEAGRTPAQRDQIARQSGVPLESIQELVRLSDLARIPGIKGVRARLYLDAGIDSIENLAQRDPDELLEITSKFVQETGFDGIPPLPAEVKSGIAKAKRLPLVVEYD